MFHWRIDCGCVITSHSCIYKYSYTMNCKNGNVNWKTQTGRWSKNTQNKEIVLHKQRSVSDKLYILLMSGLTLLQTLTSSAHAALPYSTVWIPWAPWRLHWHLVIKWSNDILQTRCFAGPPCSCWLTGGPYVITALRPPHKKNGQNLHTDVLFLTSFPPCVRFPRTARWSLSDTPASPRMLGPQMRVRNY